MFDSDKYIVGTIVYWPDETEYVFMDYDGDAKIFTRDWFFKCLIRLTMWDKQAWLGVMRNDIS